MGGWCKVIAAACRGIQSARSSRWACGAGGWPSMAPASSTAASLSGRRRGLGPHRGWRFRGARRSRGAQSATRALANFFQYTTKGIKKEIATGVKKPDTYCPVVKAGNQPLRRTREWQDRMPIPSMARPKCTTKAAAGDPRLRAVGSHPWRVASPSSACLAWLLDGRAAIDSDRLPSPSSLSQSGAFSSRCRTSEDMLKVR